MPMEPRSNLSRGPSYRDGAASPGGARQSARAAPDDAGKKLTLVMVGPTGQGKSTLGNLLAGGKGFAPFSTSDDFDSETLEASHADFAYDLQTFRAIDTIGFLDTRMDKTQNMDKFAGFADRAPGGIDAFLFVLKKGRFTEQSLGQIAAFRAIAGEEALRHTLLVFTHCGNETNESLRDRCDNTSNTHLRAAMSSCVGVVGVDSLMAGRKGDRDALLTEIKHVIKANGGRKYDNATISEARERRSELQERIFRHLSSERRDAMEEKLEGLYHGRYTFAQVHRAVEEAIEREEQQRREEEERLSLQALLQAAASEAQAWKEVARNVLKAQSAGQQSAFAACCGPPAPATYDACEVTVGEPARMPAKAYAPYSGHIGNQPDMKGWAPSRNYDRRSP
jgi:hypothetical protein